MVEEILNFKDPKYTRMKDFTVHGFLVEHLHHVEKNWLSEIEQNERQLINDFRMG